MSRYELDDWVRRSDDGRLLAGGAPARLVRLSEEGARALDVLLDGNGDLVLEYPFVDVGTSPQEVLEDCEKLFGD